MMKRVFLVILLLIISMATIGTAMASEDSFAEAYIANYIRMFGQDKYEQTTTPLTGEEYTADYIEMFGEDKYELKTTPLDAESYTARYIGMFGEEKYALHNNRVPDEVNLTPTPTPTPVPLPRPTPLPDGYWDPFLTRRVMVWNNVPSFTWLYS